jgi:hypothetical protein
MLAEVFDNPNADADSRLMASAPALLATLEGLVQAITAGRQWREPAQCVLPWLEIARNVISDATRA